MGFVKGGEHPGERGTSHKTTREGGRETIEKGAKKLHIALTRSLEGRLFILTKTRKKGPGKVRSRGSIGQGRKAPGRPQLRKLRTGEGGGGRLPPSSPGDRR